MSTFLPAIFAIMSGASCVIAGVSMIRASAARRPDAPRPGPYEGRFDVMYRPSVLTEIGRRHRKTSLIALAVSLLFFALAWISFGLAYLASSVLSAAR